MANLTSKQVKTWQTKLTTSMKALTTSFKKTTTVATQLKTTTKSADADLSYQFNDLSKLTDAAGNGITKFLNSFNTNLNKYIQTIEKAEADAKEKKRKALDNFAEIAAKINKLSM